MSKCYWEQKSQIFVIFLLIQQYEQKGKRALIILELLLNCTWFCSLRWLPRSDLVNPCWHSVPKKMTGLSLAALQQVAQRGGETQGDAPWLRSCLEHLGTLLSQPLLISQVKLGGSRSILYFSFARSVSFTFMLFSSSACLPIYM